MKLGSVYRQVRAKLVAGGIEPEEAGSMARLLIAHDRGCPPSALIRHVDDEIDPERFAPVLARLIEGEPLQYLLGETEFMGLTLRVTPAVLIPRGDSEPVVEAAVELLQDHPAPYIADICTGCGAYALALAAYLPRAELHATDISPDALAVAADNARALALTPRVQLHCGDLCAPLMAAGLCFTLVASNPPYIPRPELTSLPPQVKREPYLALDGGEDGLDYFRRLCAEAPPLLLPGGFLLLEHGAEQSAAVRRLAEEAGLAVCRVIRDYGGRDRALLAQKPALPALELEYGKELYANRDSRC